jgi:hypothetical protein
LQDHPLLISSGMQFTYSSVSFPDEFGFKCKNVFESELNVSIKAIEDGKVVGRVIASLYPPTMVRANQWEFGMNRERRLWIDDLDFVESHTDTGLDIKLIELAVEWLKKVSGDVPRKNIYMICGPKYVLVLRKLGWEVIETDDHSDDEDFPDAFAREVGCWMALPLGDSLDQETPRFESETLEDLLDIKYPHLNLIKPETYREWIDECIEDNRNPLDVLDRMKDESYHPSDIEIVKLGILTCF